MTDYTPTPEAVEAAARALWASCNPSGPAWRATSEEYRKQARAEARAALTAAGPIIAAEVERLREGVFAAATVLNREFYRRPAAWVGRLAADLRALLAGAGEQPEWEYGVKWGDEPDDSRPAICDSREHAESRAAASHGDKVVRRTPARTIPAGEWEEVPRD